MISDMMIEPFRKSMPGRLKAEGDIEVSTHYL